MVTYITFFDHGDLSPVVAYSCYAASGAGRAYAQGRSRIGEGNKMTTHMELLPQSEWPPELAEIAADLGRPLNIGLGTINISFPAICPNLAF